MKDEKYIVFKRDNWEKWQDSPEYLDPVEDAVVIRKQDTFAGPALHTYANMIGIAAKMARQLGGNHSKNLQDIADYFHEQALEADYVDSKLPD